jgi:hypothetical protein
VWRRVLSCCVSLRLLHQGTCLLHQGTCLLHQGTCLLHQGTCLLLQGTCLLLQGVPRVNLLHATTCLHATRSTPTLPEMVSIDGCRGMGGGGRGMIVGINANHVTS